MDFVFSALHNVSLADVSKAHVVKEELVKYGIEVDDACELAVNKELFDEITALLNYFNVNN
jgi:hypothetical protein